MARTIPEQFDALAIDDSLKREENPLSNGGKWTGTWFANNVGKATSTGWVTQTASKWAGAAWVNENLKEVPALMKVTLAVEPATNSTQIFLTLYGGTNAIGNENGVVLQVFRTAAEKYFIELTYREAEVSHFLGEASEVSIKSGDTLGLSFDGANLKAWRKRGTEWTELLSKTGVPSLSVFNNYSGIASANSADTTYRLTEFATGTLDVPPKPTHVASKVTGGSSRKTLVIEKPTGTVSGNGMIAVICATGKAKVAFTAPSGWTMVKEVVEGEEFRTAVYEKRAGGSEPASYEWKINETEAVWCLGTISTFKGCVAEGALINKSSLERKKGKEAKAASISPTVANCLLLDVVTLKNGSAITTPAGYLKVIEQASELLVSSLGKEATGETGEVIAPLAAEVSYAAGIFALAPQIVKPTASMTMTISWVAAVQRTAKLAAVQTMTMSWAAKLKAIRKLKAAMSMTMSWATNILIWSKARRNKQLLALDVEIETPNGTFRLPADSKNPRFKPRNISFSTQRGEGFSTASVTFSRELFKEYPDIGLLDTWRFITQAGDVVYEGRLQAAPKTNDPEEEVTINLVGWMSYLRGKKISPLIVDCRLSSWGDSSLQRRINLINAGYLLAASTSLGFQNSGEMAPGIMIDFTGVQNTSSGNPGNEMWFYGGGEDIGHVYFDQHGDTTTVWEKFCVITNNDVMSEIDLTPNYNAIETSLEQGDHASKAGRKYAVFVAFEIGTYVGQMTNKQIYSNIKVSGTHGLTRIGTWPSVGYKLTDVMEYIIRNYYPKITWAGKENAFMVQQATWHDGGQYGYDILKQLNNLALWELNMFENRELLFERADLTQYDWQFKTTDEGVKANFEGESIENFANGCSVTYTGFDGVSYTLYPSDYPELRDESPDNPYNIHDEDGWTDCDVPYQCSRTEAIQFGVVYLEEFNRPKRPGSYTLTGGFIKDAAENWQPGYNVRNGSTCGITDKIDEEPRLIVATTWDDTSSSLTIVVDAPDKLLDAIVARQEIERTVRGL